MLTKEVAVVLPLLMAILLWARPGSGRSRAQWRPALVMLTSVVAVLVGTVLAWMGVDRLSSRTGPPLLVTGGFLIVAAAFAPAFKVLDLVVRLTGRTLLRIGGEKSLRRPQPARRRSQPRPRKAA